MKKFIIFVSILGAGIIFNGCDYVSNAIEPSSNSGGGGGQDSNVVYRKILVEDYTGHRCGNCPPAAEKLHYLQATYPGKIVGMAVHAGGWAQVNGTYPTDLRCPDGNTFDAVFDISLGQGNPNGMVNRAGYGTQDFVLGIPEWEGKVIPLLTQVADFQIKITNTYAAGSNQVSSAVTIIANKPVTGKFNLSVLMVEDSIIAEQVDYRYTPNTIPAYNFMHVLRGSLNTTWGEEILNGSWNINDSIVKTYSNYQIGSNMVAKNCKIIAFVYNSDTGSSSYYEVMQVEEADVKP